MLSTQLNAQVSSQKGWFTANVVKGCWPLTVEVTHTGVRDSRLFIDYEGDSNDPVGGVFDDAFVEGETRTFTYNSPQDEPFTIVMVDQGGDPSDFSDYLDIEVIEKFSPFAGVATCSNNEVLLTLIVDEDTNTTEIDNPFDEFFIEFGDGNTQNIRTPTSGGSTMAIPHTYAANGTYTITISGLIDNGDVSQCSVFTKEISTLQSLPEPSLTNINVIDENTLFFFYDQLNTELIYSLQMDSGTGYTDIATIDPLTEGTSFELVDNSLNTLSESYNFRIRASDVCGRLEEFSQEVPNIALSYQLLGITNSFSVQFRWIIEPSNFTQARFYNDPNIVLQPTRANDNQILEFQNCTEIGLFFMESTINGVSTRSINLRPFENQVLTLPAPPPPTVVLAGNVVNLTFNTTDFSLGEIQIFRRNTGNTFDQIGTEMDLNGNFFDLTIPAGLSEACYRITYTDECGNLSNASTETCIDLAGALRLPNAFSPNGDLENDTFVPARGVFNDYMMLIYNRWGEPIFQSTNSAEGWDGNINGSPAPRGSYHYKVSYTNADNQTITKTGIVALRR